MLVILDKFLAARRVRALGGWVEEFAGVGLLGRNGGWGSTFTGAAVQAIWTWRASKKCAAQSLAAGRREVDLAKAKTRDGKSGGGK